MSNGKRRANWQTVMDAQMEPVHAASMSMQAQINALREKTEDLQSKTKKARAWMIAACLWSWLSMFLWMLK